MCFNCTRCRCYTAERGTLCSTSVYSRDKIIVIIIIIIFYLYFKWSRKVKKNSYWLQWRLEALPIKKLANLALRYEHFGEFWASWTTLSVPALRAPEVLKTNGARAIPMRCFSAAIAAISALRIKRYSSSIFTDFTDFWPFLFFSCSTVFFLVLISFIF